MAGDGLTEDSRVSLVVAGCLLDLGGEVDGYPLCRSSVKLAEAVTEGVETLGLGGRGQRGQLPGRTTIGDEGEPDVRMAKCRQNQIVLDVRTFCFLAAEEFPSGWEVEEQGPGFNGGTAGACGCLHFGDSPALQDDLGPLSGSLIALTCGQGEAAYAGN